MEQLFNSIKTALPSAAIYHDFAPNEAIAPYVIVQIVGGEGHTFVDRADGGYNQRFQVTVWVDSKVLSIEQSRAIEAAIISHINISAEGAAVADYDTEVGLHGMRQHFSVTS